MQDYWSRVCFKPWGQERLRHLDILIFHPYLYFPVSALILLGMFFAKMWGRGVLLFKRKWCTEGLPMVSMLADNLRSADSGHGWLLVSHKFCSWLSEKIFIWNHLGLAVIALHNSQKMLKKILWSIWKGPEIKGSVCLWINIIPWILFGVYLIDNYQNKSVSDWRPREAKSVSG